MGGNFLFEAALVQTYWQAAIALATGVAPKAMGSAHPLNAPYQAFEASDKWIVVGGANQKHWLRTLEVLGAKELALRSALRDRRRPDGSSEGTGGRAVSALPNPACLALAGRARGGRGALRAGQRHAAGAGRSANDRPRNGGRGRAFIARQASKRWDCQSSSRRRRARCELALRSMASTPTES